MYTPTVNEVLLALVDRYRKDRVAQAGYVGEHLNQIATATLDSFMRNVATELHQRFGLSLEGIAP